MFVALLWFCARLLCASLSTHQSCIKDTLASSLNMIFSPTSNVSEIPFAQYIFDLPYSFQQSMSDKTTPELLSAFIQHIHTAQMP